MDADKFRFTLARLKVLPATGKRYEVKDTEIPYLVCRVSPTGERFFSIYRKPRGKPVAVRVTIRDASNMATIKAEASAINALMARGINPNQQFKEADALAIKLEDAFIQYLDSRKLAGSTRESYQHALNRMAGWKNKPLRDISKVMVLEMYNEIDADSHSAAMKMAQVLRAVWNFQNDLTDDDAFGRCPTVILNKQKKQWSRTATRRRKIPREKLADWFNAVRGLDSKRMASYLEFLLLTGLRRREASGLLWADVNLKDGYFIVRNTKNHSDHCLPITKRTRELLITMRDNGALVFGVEEPKKAIRRVIEACGVEFSCHDLRRSFATFADYSGAGSYAVKGILNHSNTGDVTGNNYAGYSPLDDAGNVDMDTVGSMRESLQQIEDFILKQGNSYRDNVLELVK